MALVKNIEHMYGHTLKVTFTDGAVKKWTFDDFVGKRSKFRDIEVFKQFYVECGVLRWADGTDVCPDLMYMEGTDI